MSQTLYTKGFGAVTFSRTWTTNGGMHIGRMPNGAYGHTSGLPVTKEQDLRACIPAGEELDAALAWFENRGKAQPTDRPRRLCYFDPDDQSWRYLDTHQVVEQIEDLMAALKGGPLAEAVAWFQRQYGAQMPGAELPVPVLKSPQERVLEALHAETGQTLQGLAKLLGFDLRGTHDLLESMRDEQQLVTAGKKYFLPHELAVAGR